MRYVICGAGAIGGIIGARLQQQGRQVIFIARDATLDTLRRDGLRLRTPDTDQILAVEAVGHPREAAITADDAVVLAVKSQDTAAALDALADAAPADVPIFCAQNGVANESQALRRFRRVYGMYVYIFGLHLAPGLVHGYTAPCHGVLDLGGYPQGADSLASRVASDLAGAGFDSLCRSDVMRWKHGKLLANLANALHAACGLGADTSDIYAAARAEGEACYRAAGIAWASAEERAQRMAALLPLKQVDGAPFPGGSSWQSLARGTGSIEGDWLNGEITLLGRAHGVPTPVNDFLQQLARRMARERMRPGAMIPDVLRGQLSTAVAVGH
ncbi:ketopantoate reductase family protein [Vineibacter terrae]|uniref:ketopantoate reductase family protein n=1 Tax=Vineibacter terrae TaxID=2586908 RepID=UPI002E31DBE1|nr:2-dehydropantoate 2-reductase N-terminal domain-containing protein [Vineibacter terrae]HEX2889551.1 2-dehydropantoate 2-reductase N-terminal domain-containing protein [Vineibacter terrae]